MRLSWPLCRADRRRLPARAADRLVTAEVVPADRRSRRRRVRRARRGRVDLARGRALDRRDDRDPAAGRRRRVEDGPGRRGPGPHPGAGQDPLGSRPAPGCRPARALARCSTARRCPAAHGRAHRRHHPARRPARGRPAGRAGLRPDRARVPDHPAVHAGPVDQGRSRRTCTSRPTPSRTTSSRSSTRPACAAAASWSGQIFLEHYVPRWEDVPGAPSGWTVQALPELAEPGTPPR